MARDAGIPGRTAVRRKESPARTSAIANSKGARNRLVADALGATINVIWGGALCHPSPAGARNVRGLFIEIAFDVADRILRGRAKIAERAYALGLGLVTAFKLAR